MGVEFMYIVREQRRKIRNAAILIVVAAFAIFIVFKIINYKIFISKAKIMDEKSYRYDSYNGLILIDKDNEFIGYYYEAEPLSHDNLPEVKFLSCGYYKLLEKEDGSVVLVSLEDEYPPMHWELNDNPEYKKLFKNARVLVYKK